MMIVIDKTTQHIVKIRFTTIITAHFIHQDWGMRICS